MGDARPVHGMFLVVGVVLAGIALWWLLQADADREAGLRAIVQVEQAPRPPASLWDQPAWLVQHRWEHLQGMGPLGLLALVMGAGQGWIRRRRDPQAGFRHRLWTLGVCTLPLLVGSLAVYLIVPRPVPLVVMAGGLALLLGWASYALVAGQLAIS